MAGLGWLFLVLVSVPLDRYVADGLVIVYSIEVPGYFLDGS